MNESNYDGHDTILSCDVNNVELHQIFSSLFIKLALTAFFFIIYKAYSDDTYLSL